MQQVAPPNVKERYAQPSLSSDDKVAHCIQVEKCMENCSSSRKKCTIMRNVGKCRVRETEDIIVTQEKRKDNHMTKKKIEKEKTDGENRENSLKKKTENITSVEITHPTEEN